MLLALVIQGQIAKWNYLLHFISFSSVWGVYMWRLCHPRDISKVAAITFLASSFSFGLQRKGKSLSLKVKRWLLPDCNVFLFNDFQLNRLRPRPCGVFSPSQRCRTVCFGGVSDHLSSSSCSAAGTDTVSRRTSSDTIICAHVEPLIPVNMFSRHDAQLYILLHSLRFWFYTADTVMLDCDGILC